ncbi:hypothetical protein PULV_a3945 [Pseudoalteromonas ulvae UL12]|uniref:hypothetical protein n=1 Tax=Pseudoalteromonas ulvae TaxID=107327 RepID=UPI00186B99FA|nr:hypothetical protein [Pseudoalteromonas ulvae]MBE0362141.1 hypothetical protein [Pseudoalteromonas ulvae UL12]
MRLGYSYTISSYLIALTIQRCFLSHSAGDNWLLLAIALLIYSLSLLKPTFTLGLIPLGLFANYTHELIYISGILNAMDLHLATALFGGLTLFNHLKPAFTHSTPKMMLSKVKLGILLCPIVIIFLLQLYYSIHVIAHITAQELMLRFIPLLIIAGILALSNRYTLASMITTLIIGGSSFILAQLAAIFWFEGLKFDGVFLVGIALLCMYFSASSYKEVAHLD